MTNNLTLTTAEPKIFRAVLCGFGAELGLGSSIDSDGNVISKGMTVWSRGLEWRVKTADSSSMVLDRVRYAGGIIRMVLFKKAFRLASVQG